MKLRLADFLRRGAGMLAIFCCAFLMLGCATERSYVVLLDNADGTVGKIQVTTATGTTQLSSPKFGSYLAGPVAPPFLVPDDMLAKDFGRALNASPVRPATFLLYFEAGGSKLTELSQADIPKILAEVGTRAAPDVSIIGHTDTTGNDEANLRLGLARAQLVAGMLSPAKLDADHLRIDSHGKKNMLVKTPDNTDEARNRRVEVTVR